MAEMRWIYGPQSNIDNEPLIAYLQIPDNDLAVSRRRSEVLSVM